MLRLLRASLSLWHTFYRAVRTVTNLRAEKNSLSTTVRLLAAVLLYHLPYPLQGDHLQATDLVNQSCFKSAQSVNAVLASMR